jgi:hypothetical protein
MDQAAGFMDQEQRWLLAGCLGFGHVPAGGAFSSTDQTKQGGKEQSRTVLVLSAIRGQGL